MSEFMRNEFYPTNAGSPTEIVYRGKVERDGTINLVEDGVRDVYMDIQSHKDSCSIELALKRFALGDVSALQQRQGAYGDFTTFPRTFAEVLQVMINAENYFDSLPAEIRRNFDNDLNKFLASLDSPEHFASKMGIDLSSTKDVQVSGQQVAAAPTQIQSEVTSSES